MIFIGVSMGGGVQTWNFPFLKCSRSDCTNMDHPAYSEHPSIGQIFVKIKLTKLPAGLKFNKFYNKLRIFVSTEVLIFL